MNSQIPSDKGLTLTETIQSIESSFEQFDRKFEIQKNDVTELIKKKLRNVSSESIAAISNSIEELNK